MFIKKQRMIELQNVNLRLRAGGNVKKRNWYLILGMLLLVQLIAIFYFGSKKAGFHYDEYYSYYSSNVSIWCRPTGSGSRAARLRTNSGFCRGSGFSMGRLRACRPMTCIRRFTICCCIRYARCFPEGSANGQELD